MVKEETLNKMAEKSMKPRLDLIEPEFIVEMGKIMSYGCIKYEKDSWKLIHNPQDNYFGACMRHLMAYRSGEIRDNESGLLHLAHAAVNIMFLMYFDNLNGVNKNEL